MLITDLTSMDPRRFARSLFFQGWTITAIADQIGQPRATVESWKQRDGWAGMAPIDRVDVQLEARLIQLIMKDEKSGSDYKEIDLLGRQMERIARVRRYEQPGGHEGDLNPNVANRNAGPKKKAVVNEYSPEQAARLREAFIDESFDYQRRWLEAIEERIRVILKSRQIGATFYFAREALVDAMASEGNNQIFLSASRAQANVFKDYIRNFAKAAADIELRGSETIILPNQSTMYFLGTNSRTAQSYHGNLYFDEFFWVYGFEALRKLAAGMSSQKRWRQTLFSTPATLGHEAYPYWTGKQFNRGRPKNEHVHVDVSHAALKGGVRCADGKWRHIVNILDALAGGAGSLFDLDQLRLENSADEFNQLFMCQFIDDSASVFSFDVIMKCMIDSWDLWEDWRQEAPRPIGYAPVSIGYDPSKGTSKGDPSGCTVTALPTDQDDVFRVLEKHQWQGHDFQAQADKIRELTTRYNVVDIAIDVTGLGDGVYQLVKVFFPQVRAITYSPETKSRMVMKAQDVMGKQRLQFDAGWTDLAAAFMAIRRTNTASGRHTTYEAGRSEETGHADLAWSVMHSLTYEPIAGREAHGSNVMEIY